MAYPKLLYDNRLEDTTSLTATSTAAGMAVENLLDGRSYTFWEATAAGTNYITVDCGVVKAADALGIVGHNLYTANATVVVQSSTDSFAANVVERLAGFTPTSDKAIMKTFTSSSGAQWRVKIETVAVAPKIAVVKLGEALTFPNGAAVPAIPYTVRTSHTSKRSKAGYLLGSAVQFKPVELSYSIQPSPNNYSWWSGDFKTFWNDHGSEMKPFFWALDIDTFPDDVFYVKLPDEASYEIPMTFTNLVESVRFNMEGIVE